jgi:hypothetical protein
MQCGVVVEWLVEDDMCLCVKASVFDCAAQVVFVCCVTDEAARCTERRSAAERFQTLCGVLV